MAYIILYEAQVIGPDGLWNQLFIQSTFSTPKIRVT